MTRVLVTGAQGFIGSHFADLLDAEGVEVVRWDARFDPLQDLVTYPPPGGFDWVAHFAAHASVDDDPVHWDALTMLRRLMGSAPRILFASSSAALNPTSLYGASKAACEQFLKAWAAQGNTVLVGRWDLVFGERYARGHVRDFVQRLLVNPDRLELAGDALRSGIYVKDLCRGLWLNMQKITRGYNEREFSTGEVFRVKRSAQWVAERMGLSPVITAPKPEPQRMYPTPYGFITKTVREAIEITVDDLLCASIS